VHGQPGRTTSQAAARYARQHAKVRPVATSRSVFIGMFFMGALGFAFIIYRAFRALTARDYFVGGGALGFPA
jgi:hypothetical protein